MINVTSSFTLLQVKLSEPHRAERNSNSRTNFKMVVSTPRNTFRRMTTNKTKIYGEQDAWYIKDCSIRNNDSNASSIIKTITVKRPKANSMYQLTHWNALKIPENAPIRSLLHQISGLIPDS